MRIAYVTAGGAGMFCGSCMHDNTLAAALIKLGCDVQLIPTYTPIRTDEEDVSIQQVFLGGINVYLQEKLPLFRHLPRALDRWLNQPWLIRKVASGSIETSAAELGQLTVSLLRGEAGHQRKEIQRLVDWLVDDCRPQLLNLTNVLISSCVPMFRARSSAPVLVTLQGDDIFFEGLVEPYRSQALEMARKLAANIDGFLVFNEYYADFMSSYLDIPRERFHVVPLGIQVRDFPSQPAAREGELPTIGYFARICEAKGLHVLVDAFIRLKSMPGMAYAQLRIGGWLGKGDEAYFAEQTRKLTRAGLISDVRHEVISDRKAKIRFLRELDVFSVPTTYREPKGLYVLEALAAGVAVVQPDHGAFPELLSVTGGGRLTPPHDPTGLASALHQWFMTPAEQRRQEVAAAQKVVHERLNAIETARETLRVYREFVEPHDAPLPASA